MQKVKMEHFRNLISLVGADGKIEDVERITLAKIAYEQGIPLDRLNFMLKKSNEYAYIIPQNQVDREKQLHDMMSVALVDGEFAKAERELIILVGGKLGFSKEDVEKMIGERLNIS